MIFKDYGIQGARLYDLSGSLGLTSQQITCPWYQIFSWPVREEHYRNAINKSGEISTFLLKLWSRRWNWKNHSQVLFNSPEIRIVKKVCYFLFNSNFSLMTKYWIRMCNLKKLLFHGFIGSNSPLFTCTLQNYNRYYLDCTTVRNESTI